MKIAYIVPSLINTGPTIVIHTLCHELMDMGCEVIVYYFDKKPSMEFRCKTQQIDFNKPIDFDSFDIIHSNMLRPDKYIYKWRKHIKKAKTVTTIHQDIFQNLRFSYNTAVSALFTPLWKLYISKFDVAVAISNKIYSLYENLSTRVLVVYNGINVMYDTNAIDPQISEHISEFRNRNKDKLILGTYANINRRKGVDMMIDLLQKRNDIAMIIIGEGKEKDRLRGVVNDRRQSERVLFLPYLDAPYNYLQYIDIYVMPSRSEGFGLALVEAAMTKTPVICSDISVFREIFSENEARFFELENISSLSEQVDVLLSQEEREKYANNAYKRSLTNFTSKTMAKNYLTLYQDLLK